MRLIAADTYNYLKFGNRIFDLKVLIIGLYGGFVIGIILTFINTVHVGSLVRALLSEKAFSPENAYTLKELGIRKTPFIRAALKDSSFMRKVVSIGNEDAASEYVEVKTPLSFLKKKKKTKKKYDLGKLTLYIPEEKKYTAETRYESSKKNVLILVVSFILLTALALFSFVAIPDLLRLLDNFLTLNLD